MREDYYQPERGALKVNASDEVELAGRSGNAPVTLTCRWPDGAPPRAFVLFCHGLGASGRDYGELSAFWAAHGYLVVHPTFPDWIGAVAAAEPELGLDPNADNLSAWTTMPDVSARMHQILHTPFYWLERIRIVRQTLDGAAEIINATAGATGGLPPLAIAGHSFGAYTSQLFAGAQIEVPGKGAKNFRDERLAAAILLSAQGRDQQGLRDGSWDAMTGPVLTVTGTLDRGARGQGWDWKSEPYELAPPGAKYLAILDEADHYLGGFAKGGAGADVPEQREAVKQVTLAFLDAHIGGDDGAKSWLASISDRIGRARVVFKRK